MNTKLFKVASIPQRLACFALPLALASTGCSDGAGDLVGGSGGATVGTGGTGVGGTGTGGAANTGGAGSGGAGTGGTVVIGTGGVIVVDTVECEGPFPTEDVSAAEYKVAAGGGSLGVLPHFWNTFGLGRLGLYLPSSSLDAAFQGQDKTNFDTRKWSEVFREQTVEAVQTLGMNSVRAHGTFHDDIGIYSEDSAGTPVYNWTRSDEIFHFLVDSGIAPIVELASMPAALALDPSQTVFDWKMIVSPPKDYAKWGDLVEAFVAHSVAEFGAEEVNKWYFEVWNEPECCDGKFWKGGPEGYFQLYDEAAAGVKAALPTGRVGGPVSSQPAQLTGGEWDGGAGVQFLNHIGDTGSLDFFSFHTWDFLDGSVNGYFQGLDLLDSHGKTTVPIAVTEFGPTWEFGLREVGMDGVWEPQERDQGATFVAQTYANIAQKCALESKRFPITYAWWTLSDVFDEGYDDSEDYVLEQNPFIGAMGLYSRESIKKPAYNAYKFLAQLGTEQQTLTVEGNPGDVGGMAARDTVDGGIQVLLYNGQDPGGGFSVDSYYTVAPAATMGVTVTGLNPDMAYDVTAYRVDETHGNAFALWDAQGRPTMSAMSAENWQALRDGMESPPEPVAAAVCGTTFSQTFSLSSPGVLLLTLEPAVAAPTTP